jgi:hypothetical protein
MDFRKVVRDYSREFENMNTKGLLAFFAPHAKIHSPVFGHKDPSAFYAEAFSRTKSIKVDIKDIYVNPDRPHHLAAHLTFKWELKTAPAMDFEGVVLYDLSPQGKIQRIDIIYDAERARHATSN